MDYLLLDRHIYDNIGEALAIRSQSVRRGFYSQVPLASLIYVACKEYDKRMNDVLEGVTDNNRVYLYAENTSAHEKLKQMRHSKYQVLDPDTKLIQQGIQRPIQESANVARILIDELNSDVGQYRVGERQAAGTYKTAEQVRTDLTEQNKINSAQIKVFVAQDTYFVREIYRRWVNEMTENDEGYKNRERFEEYLDSKDVPKEAYDPENVLIESVVNLGAGSPAARLQSANIILEALAYPARSEGERRAVKDKIAAAAGMSNVQYYLDEAIEDFKEDALIGIENEMLCNPYTNPQNVRVHSAHLHVRHAERHIAEVESKLELANGLMQSIPQTIEPDQGIIFHKIADLLIGIDNIGAHIYAHQQVAGRLGGAERIKPFIDRLAQVQRITDEIANQLDEAQSARIKEHQEKFGQNPELANKQRVLDAEYEHTVRMNQIAQETSLQKAEQLREQSAINSVVKQELERIRKENKEYLDRLVAENKIALQNKQAEQ